jgi:hypothetical protein
MRVVVYCTGRSDKPVLERFAGFAGQPHIPIRVGYGGGEFGVTVILNKLPEIAEFLIGQFEKVIVVLDSSELNDRKRNQPTRKWMEKAANAVPQGITICIVYMNLYLEEVIKACLPPELHDEFDREQNKVRQAMTFAGRIKKELAESNTSYEDFAAALKCDCRRVLTVDHVQAGMVFPEAE